MYKTIYDYAAEITQDVIKARGEAINGEKELIETYLSDEAVSKLYKKIFKVQYDHLILYEVGVGKNYFLPQSNYCQPSVGFQNSTFL
ncbi:hypothetical protein [Neobacillus sp.]|uniref:hypothetical protein n=1 Tax=Neobacillus sp. TaxID=2675273 RepID=UPI0028A14CBB|nr:hypothetical protein [Neobacillus sp.]